MVSWLTNSSAAIRFGCCLLLLGCVVSDGGAHDLGTHGQTYAVQEPNLIDVMQARIRNFVDSGQYERWKEDSIERARQTLREPPGADVTYATVFRSWLFDPSIPLSQEIADKDGRVLIQKGTRVNPLHYVSLLEPMIFFDGNSSRQAEWAKALYEKEGGKPILTSGKWIDISNQWGRQVFYDMNGVMCKRFGIAHVPAVVRQEGDALRISEVAVE